MADGSTAEGTPLIRGELWTTRARDWAEQEERQRALYEEADRDAGLAAIAAMRTEEGYYRFATEWRYVVGTA